MDSTYLFNSERLGFRNWVNSDIELMIEINTDSKVMEFFPSISSKEKTIDFIEGMQQQFSEKGICYFAVDKLENEEFIGFIGLSIQTFESSFTPCIDIGWRLASKEWNKGYATEGAKKCLDYAFNILKITKVNSIAPIINLKSQLIMEKIGMKKQYEFKHPLLLHDERLHDCVLYEIVNIY